MEEASSELSQILHTPEGAERKAIFAGMRAQLSVDLNGQEVYLNATDPVGRFLAHGEWAYFEGILEGPNANTTPIDYANSKYAQEFSYGYLAGVQRNGHFAAKFQSLLQRSADGTWKIAVGVYGEPTYSVGPNWDNWRDWAPVPPVGSRDVFVSYPSDDLHEPQGEERSAIVGALRARMTEDLHGQQATFNASDPPGTFLSHDGWAFFEGIIEGPNGNTTPIDYRNSVFAEASQTTAFQGVLRNNNFAAVCRASSRKRRTERGASLRPRSKARRTPGTPSGRRAGSETRLRLGMGHLRLER